MRFFQVFLCLSTLVFLPRTSLAQDLVELLDGSSVEGKLLAIRKEAKEFDFGVSTEGGTIKRTYAYGKVAAVSINGERYVFDTKTESASGGPSGNASGNSGSSSSPSSRAEIERLIEEVGSTPPGWYDDAPLEYPQTLDLSWPLKPQGKGWQANKYVFHYLWSNVYPNPGRWKSGVKLIHHILPKHRDAPALLARDMQELGHMYFRLFQDYPRAAFWYRKSGAEKGTAAGVHLAECYWRLGSKEMALEELKSRTVPLETIKLYSEMGDTDRALQLVGLYVRAGRPMEACLLGGDACRSAGRLEEAMQYYQKVLQSSAVRNEEYLRRFHARAKESIEAIRLSEQADPKKVADGTYSATTTGYAGPLEVKVTVVSGRIELVQVAKHREKQFYSALKDIPQRIVTRQSVEGIDAISGATVTSQAIVNATAKALASGAR
jgi:uncharacterized protein with FMN-binding domain